MLYVDLQTLHFAPCSDLSIDAMDVSGEHQLDVLHSVFKVRLTEDGRPIEEATQQYDLGAKEEEPKEEDSNAVVKKMLNKPQDKCGRLGTEHFVVIVIVYFDNME